MKNLENFYKECKINLNLDIIGLMCLPPKEGEPEKFFEQLKEHSIRYDLSELSMGMSNDFEIASKCGSTFIRIGTKIFGSRT